MNQELKNAYDCGHLRYYHKLLMIALEYKAQAIEAMHDRRAKAELVEDTDVELVCRDIRAQIKRLCPEKQED